MRLVTFEIAEEGKRAGAIAPDGRIVDLNRACALYLREVEKETAAARLADALVPARMRRLFEGGEESLAAARRAFVYAVERGGEARRGARKAIVHSREAVRLRAPIEPKKFFHTAGNFREHHEEAERASFSHPVLPWIVFFQNVDAIIGPDEPVVYPDQLTEELDYELELAVVVKKPGSYFTAEEAKDYIGGYVIFNDITARDIQRREMKSGVFSFCKAIRTFCPLGPWIVTAEEIPDPHNLAMELRVNGEVRQRSHSSRMAVTIEEILAHYSPMGYSAGDVVSTGTVSGVAAFSGNPKLLYLKPGDVIEAEIEKIGVLRNPVISWEEAYGRKAPRAV
jgi:2-keto-4-pentenoate hydratase/2-oxohepta-3-ene-1,7-dioic acid hydratase in catechol pathway